MVVKTKGLVLKTVHYSETSIIATIYTSALGLRSYMLKGVRSTRGKRKGNIYQPLQFLDLVVIDRANKNLQYVREVKVDFIYKTILYDIRKTAIGLFLLELISLAVKEMEGNEELYLFIENQFKSLDAQDNQFSTFHLHFMLAFAEQLGFYPLNNYSEQHNLFALQDGQFVSTEDLYPNVLSSEDSLLIHRFLSNKNPLTSKNSRKKILTILEKYYQFHLPDFKQFKTPIVFEDIFG